VVKKDPRVPATDADLVRQFELSRQIEAERVRLAIALKQSDEIRKQLAALRPKATGAAAAALEDFSRKLGAFAASRPPGSSSPAPSKAPTPPRPPTPSPVSASARKPSLSPSPAGRPSS